MNKTETTTPYPENIKFSELIKGPDRDRFTTWAGVSRASIEAFLRGRRSGKRLKLTEKAELFVVMIADFEKSLTLK